MTAIRSAPIEVRDLEKSFRIPTHRIDSFKERALHPVARSEYRELHALRRDLIRCPSRRVLRDRRAKRIGQEHAAQGAREHLSGRCRHGGMAGRVAPFIELGVGFNPELTARENVVLNGVMMGLSRRESQRRLAAVLDFAELEDFVDLKLKNYSSGMMVRLAFSVMVQAEADILLIDEVLAVGDAGSRRSAREVFRGCAPPIDGRARHSRHVGDRGLLRSRHADSRRRDALHRGPAGGGRRYSGRTSPTCPSRGGAEQRGVPEQQARLVEAWLENGAGQPRRRTVETGEPIGFQAILEARRDLVNPEFGFECRNAEVVDGLRLQARARRRRGERRRRLASGERARIAGDGRQPR